MQTGKEDPLHVEDSTPGKRLSTKVYIQLLLGTLLGALYIVSAVNPARMDADLVVSSLASLKNPTLYYWGQDRLFSLIPIMLLPFRNIEWNLYLNTFLQATFFSALILLILLSTVGKSTNIPALLMVSLVVLNYTIPKPELFTFAKHSQPYASSTAAIIAAFYINTRSVQLENLKSQKALCFFLVTIGLLLNPLTLLFGLSLFVAQIFASTSDSLNNWHHNISIGLRWVGILLPAFIVTAVSKHIYSQNYDIVGTPLEINVSNFTPALKITVERFIGSFNGNYLALILATIGLLTCLYPCLRTLIGFIYCKLIGGSLASRLSPTTSRYTHIYAVIACAATFNLLTLLPILSSEWYYLNDYSLRYIFPLYLAITVGACRALSYIYHVLLSNYQLSNMKAGNYSPRLIKAAGMHLALASCVSAILIGSLRPIAPDLLTYNEFSRVQPAYSILSQTMHARSNIFIGGSYWLSWPFKALGLREGNDIGVITERSKFDPLSRQREDLLDDHIRRGEEFTFICLSEGQDTSNCDSLLKGKIDRLSVNPNSWEFDVPAKPISYSIHGETYATTMNYKTS